MSNASDDKLVDDYLSGDTPYSARYRGMASADVPSELDGTILEQARTAGRTPKRRSFKWVAPAFAIAATAVLTLSIVLRNSVGTSDYRAEGVVQNEVVVTTQLETPRESSMPLSAPSITLEAPAAAAPKAKEDTAARANESAEKERAFAFPESKVAANEPVLADKKAESSRPPAAPAAGAERRVLQESVPAAPSTRIASADAAALASGAQRAEVDRLMQKDARAKQKAESESVVVTGTYRRDVPEEAALPVEVISSEELQQRGISRTADREVDRTSPANWLKYIRALRASDLQVEADAEWKKFVQTFPKYPVARGDSARPK